MANETKKTMPAQAFRVAAGACEFAADQSAEKPRGPIKLTASSGEAFNHRYWGRLVFDYSGMKLAKPKVTLDYCHRSDDVVGYADKIDTSGGKLIVAGELVSSKPGDRASEILVKGMLASPTKPQSASIRGTA